MDDTAQAILRGALRAWGTLNDSMFLTLDDTREATAIRDAAGHVIASVRRQTSPLGWVWSVRLGDRRERLLPSVVTALRYLRSHLCPERAVGQVLFGPGEHP